MITLDEYKEYLVSFIRHKIDDTNERKNERRNVLDKRYGDELLTKIILDTYDFIKDIIDMDTVESGYASVELDDDTTSYISLNITGGGFCDTLYRIPDDRIISNYIMQSVFGPMFYIGVNEDAFDFETGDDIMSFDFRYSLCMQGFPNNIQDIKENLFGTTR